MVSSRRRIRQDVSLKRSFRKEALFKYGEEAFQMNANKWLGLLKGHLNIRAVRPAINTRSLATSSTTPSSPNSPSQILTTITPIPIPSHPSSTIATVTVSNPAKLNILNTSLLTQLQHSLAALSSHHTLRAVILTGAPHPTKSPAFIGGADITEMAAISSPAAATRFITGIHDVCSAIRTLPVPVVARVHGFTLGAGLEILASCDLRVATRVSLFGMPEVRVGIPSVVEAALLPNLIGWGRTRRLLYLAETINAEKALQWGLIEEMVEDIDELDRMIEDWVGRISENGQKAMKTQKALMQKWEGGAGVEEGIEAGIGAFASAWENGGVEPREMMGRFLGRKR